MKKNYTLKDFTPYWIYLISFVILEVIAFCVPIIFLLGLVFWPYAGVFHHQTYDKKHLILTEEASIGAYQLSVYEVGEPDWPFGSTHCLVELREDDRKITEYAFDVCNDGAHVDETAFEVKWNATSVLLVSYGEEQDPRKILISFANGKVNTWSDKQEEQKEDREVEQKTDTAEITEPVIEPKSEEEIAMEYCESETIYKGYVALYDTFFATGDYTFTPYANAKGNSRFVLRDDSQTYEYITYDRPSKNGSCELYVYYQCDKMERGEIGEEKMLDIFAYDIYTGKVERSGKTNWADLGSETYRQLTGE